MAFRSRGPRHRRGRRRTRVTNVLGAGACGAAVMYLFDPRDGRRRRAVARDRSMALFRDVGRRASRKRRYYAGKRRGVAHGLRGDGPTEVPNDATLQHKIESEVLRNYPKGRVNVNVEEGVAVLRGVLDHRDDIRRLVDDVCRVTGVLDVESLLHLPGTPAPGYTGTRTRARRAI